MAEVLAAAAAVLDTVVGSAVAAATDAWPLLLGSAVWGLAVAAVTRWRPHDQPHPDDQGVSPERTTPERTDR